MALLTAKIHNKQDLEKEIIALAEENGKKIQLNEEEVEQIKDESNLIVPLKKVVPSSNKECIYFKLSYNFLFRIKILFFLKKRDNIIINKI